MQLAIPPFPLSAATTQDLVEALAIDAWVSDAVFTIGTGDPRLYLAASVAVAAAAFPEDRAILLSTGMAADRGLGNTDWGEDGARDVASFTFTLTVPPAAKTLVFSTQFITSEYGPSGIRKGDMAFVLFSWTPCGGIGCMTAPLPLHDASGASDTVNPFVRNDLRVDRYATIRLRFWVADRDDGFHDSAFILRDVYFFESRDVRRPHVR